jgi:exodeoxyribonuclease III
VYDPAAFIGSTHVTEPERERFRALLGAGTMDAFRELEPAGPGFTWWDYRAGHFHKEDGTAHRRLPAVAAAGGAAALVRDRSQLPQGPKPSDHAPLLAELAE